jgi:hypothetical protein
LSVAIEVKNYAGKQAGQAMLNAVREVREAAPKGYIPIGAAKVPIGRRREWVALIPLPLLGALLARDDLPRLLADVLEASDDRSA